MTWLDSTRAFAYDTLYRVNTSHLKDTQNWTSASQQTTNFQYDTQSNRISHSYRGATAIGYGHDKANRMTTQAAVSQGYDLRGNLTLGYSADRSSSYTYSYDHNDRLSGVIAGGFSIVDYRYDALGRRVEYYDGANEMAEFIQSTIWGGFPPGRVVRRGFVLSPLPRLGVWRD